MLAFAHSEEVAPLPDWERWVTDKAEEWAKEQGGCEQTVRRNVEHVLLFARSTIEIGVEWSGITGITPEAVEAFKHLGRVPSTALNVKRRVAGRPLAPNTVASALPAVRSCCAYYGNRIAGRKRLWRLAARAEPIYISWLDTPAELQALLNSTASDPALQAMVVLCGPCQLRAAEAMGVTISDLSLGPGRSTVRVLRGKFGKARIVAIPPHAVASLIAVAAGKPASARIWPYGRTTLWRRLDRACRAAGIARATPHTLRRSVARFARRGNVRLEFVQRRMGHASSETTLRYYVGDDAAATESEDLARLDAILRGA